MSRHQLRLLACACALVVISGAGCSVEPGGSSTPADTRAADEAAIRAATHTFDQALVDKDLDKAASLYEDDAVLFVPKAPAMVGKDAIRKAWQDLMAVPNVKVTDTVTKVDLARSGDLGVAHGKFELVSTDKEGKPNAETGLFVLVFRKQADGSWKIIADTSADDK
jgi:uncharacterized protein (TIGR02246 family)